jgi:arginine exporter protein ArgO
MQADGKPVARSWLDEQDDAYDYYLAVPLALRVPGGRRESTAGCRHVGMDRAGTVMREALIAGLLAGYGIAVPVGAIAALLVGLSARTSFRIGAAAALGVATADGLYAIAAALGGTSTARLVASAAVPLRWTAGAVLIALAVRTGVIAVRQHRSQVTAQVSAGLASSPGRAFAGLLGLTLLNPVTIIYFGALVLGGQANRASSLIVGTVFAVAAFAASASWQLLLAGGGAALGRFLTGRRGRLVTALISSAVIIFLAANLLLSA